MEDKCSVGELTLTDCHQFSYGAQKAIENVNDLSEDEQILLKLRTESEQELQTICLHHKSIFLKKFEFLQKLCCDPIKKHKKPIKKALRAINVQQSEIIMSKGYKIKPGQKLCSSCRNLLLKSEESKAASYDEKECLSQDDSDEKEVLSHASDDIGLPSEEFFELEKKETLNLLNASFTEAGSSPLKLHALSEHSKKHYGKRKLEQLKENVKQKIEKVLEVELPMEESESEETIQQKAADMDKLTEIMKKQLQLTSKKKKFKYYQFLLLLCGQERK